jgi:hypothetical protein
MKNGKLINTYYLYLYNNYIEIFEQQFNDYSVSYTTRIIG